MFCLLLGAEAQGDPAEGEVVFGAEARFVLRHRPGETAEGLEGKMDKNGLTPAQYDFLWRAQFNEAGEIVRLEKINVS